MTVSPFWLPRRNTHIDVDADSSFTHKNLAFCRVVEPWNRQISSGPVTTFTLRGDNWTSSRSNPILSWYESAAKTMAVAAAWMMVVPILLQMCYIERAYQMVWQSYIGKLYSKLERETDPEKIMLIKMDIVAEVLRTVPENQRVVIVDREGTFSCRAHLDYKQTYLPDVILAHIESEEKQAENRETLQFFLVHFGRERSQRLFAMMGVDVDYHERYGLGLTRKQVVSFFALTAFVHIEDMRHFYQQLVANQKAGYLYLSAERVQEIVETFSGDQFDALRKTDYDVLWDLMVPLSLSTMFVDRLEKDDPDQHRGRLLDSILKGLYVEEMHLKNHPDMSQRDYDYALIKSLLGGFRKHDEVSIEGKVIRQPKGYGWICSMIAAGGCFCIPIKSMDGTRREERLDTKNREEMYRYDTYLSRLVFLPTQLTSFLPGQWESMMGAVRKDMGERGALAIWPRIQKLFQKEGFQRVDCIGTSMGGTQAAKITTLDLLQGERHVRKLTLVCAPTETKETAELFAELVEQQATRVGEGEYVLKVNSVWQWGDCAHRLGDRELATEAIAKDIVRVQKGQQPMLKHKVHWYCTQEEDSLLQGKKPEKQQAPGSMITTIYEAFMALIGPHREDLVAEGEHVVHSHSSVTERTRLLELLPNETFGWESVREFLVQIVHPQAMKPHFVDAAKKLCNH